MHNPYAKDRLPVPDATALTVIPLGGTSRVGMNATLIGYNGRWLIIDAGATFVGADDAASAAIAERFDAQIAQIIPDVRILESIRRNIDGIVITHSHEDHIGALQPLYCYSAAWPWVRNLPIYATDYTRAIIRRKLDEVGGQPTIHRMKPRSWIRFRSGLDVLPINVTHSAPQTVMLALRTRLGVVVFGSDAKLDPAPMIGRTTDTGMLESLGRNGVLAYLGDSTNADRAGHSASEAEVSAGLEQIMRQRSGRVIVSTFGSNIARVAGVAQAARGASRLLGGFGRTLLVNTEIAENTGVLARRQVAFSEPRFLDTAPGRHIAIVCTGTQAEMGSALRRAVEDLDLGRRSRNGLQLAAGDTLVHSARTIPGNEGAVSAMFETMRAHGVTVIEPDNADGLTIHASGHAKRDEIADFYRMLRPRFSIPVHGDRRLIDAHIDLARSMKVEAALSPAEGEIMRISPSGVTITGSIPVGELAVLSIGGRNSGEGRLIPWGRGRPIDAHRTSTRHRPSSPRRVAEPDIAASTALAPG